MAEQGTLEYLRNSREHSANEGIKQVSAALDSLGRVVFDSPVVEDALGGARLALLLLLGILAREASTVRNWKPPAKTEGR